MLCGIEMYLVVSIFQIEFMFLYFNIVKNIEFRQNLVGDDNMWEISLFNLRLVDFWSVYMVFL